VLVSSRIQYVAVEKKEMEMGNGEARQVCGRPFL
jgi:hypothetical protein